MSITIGIDSSLQNRLQLNDPLLIRHIDKENQEIFVKGGWLFSVIQSKFAVFIGVIPTSVQVGREAGISSIWLDP